MADNMMSRQAKPDIDQTLVRETLRRRLQFAVGRVGSVSTAAALIGVNRTQFSRYLSGKSQPRPDLLYRLSQKLELPLAWFFDSSGADGPTLLDHQFGACMGEMVRGKRIAVDEATLPDGFYVVWKGTFLASQDFEHLIGMVGSRNGVRMFKVAARWQRRAERSPALVPRRERHYTLVAMRSTNGLFLFSLTGSDKRAVTLHLRETAMHWGHSAGPQFAGFACSTVFGAAGNSCVVPILLARHEPAPGNSILDVARRTGGYMRDELPDAVRRELAALGVPQVRVQV